MGVATIVAVPYSPRTQFRSFHQTMKRFGVLVCHRRAGKTVAAINHLVREVLMCSLKDPRGAFIAPTFAQAKDIAWLYLKRYTNTIPGMKYHESELRAVFPTGAQVRLYGAENVDRLRGIYLDCAIFDEFPLMPASIWTDIVRPLLTDRQGKAYFLGTPAGEDAFFQLYEYAVDHPDDWFSLKLKASDTQIIPQDELDKARALMTEESYQREFEVSFSAAFPGTYYASYIEQASEEKRIRFVAHDKAVDVYTGWDLGIGDQTGIWTAQIVGVEWHILKYYQNSGKGLDHYLTYIKALPYPVANNFLPHDARARELQSGKSRTDFFDERGVPYTVLPSSLVADGINAVRMMLNRAWFDKEGTSEGVRCLRQYRSEFKDKTNVLALRPRHDAYSHGADAFRTLVMGINERYLQTFKRSDWKKPISRASQGTYV